MSRQLLTTVLVVLGSIVPALAQESAYPRYPQPQSMPHDNILVQHHASTAAEGYLRGMADWMRGYGESLRSQAEADCFAETADGLSLQNRKARVAQFWYLKEQYAKHYQASHRRAGQSAHKAAEPMSQTTRRAVEKVASTGAVSWPVVLQCKSCRAACQKLDAMFAGRAAGIQPDPSAQRNAQHAIDRLLADLKSRIKTTPTKDYLEAKNFLTSMKGEVRQFSGEVLVAQN
jgi:hypothetical protein